MRKTMRTALLLAAAVGLGACQTHNAMEDDAIATGTGQTVVLNIVSGPDQPHPVTMALQLAGHALDDGRAVVLFFNVKAVDVPLKSLPADLAYHDKPIAALLEKLIDRGATVLVCPHCMKAQGIDADDLVDGAEVADRLKLFRQIDAGAVVFTY